MYSNSLRLYKGVTVCLGDREQRMPKIVPKTMSGDVPSIGAYQLKGLIDDAFKNGVNSAPTRARLLMGFGMSKVLLQSIYKEKFSSLSGKINGGEMSNVAVIRFINNGKAFVSTLKVTDGIVHISVLFRED